MPGLMPVRRSQSCSAAAATPQDWLEVASLTEGALSPIGCLPVPMKKQKNEARQALTLGGLFRYMVQIGPDWSCFGSAWSALGSVFKTDCRQHP